MWQNGANSPNSKSNKSQDPVDSSVEETESIDLLQNLNNQNQSDIDLVHNKNPTQELQLILSSDSESDERNRHLHFEKDSMLGPKIKEPDSVNSHRRSKIKNIFGNYVSISDEEGDEDEENGEENEIEREEKFESPQIHNALEDSNDYQTIDNVKKKTSLDLSVNDKNSNVISSESINYSPIRLHSDNSSQNDTNLKHKSIQVDESENDRSIDCSDPKAPIENNEQTHYLNEREKYLSQNNSISKKIDSKSTHEHRNSTKVQKANHLALLSNPPPSIDSVIKSHQHCLTFLSSLSLDKPNERY